MDKRAEHNQHHFIADLIHNTYKLNPLWEKRVYRAKFLLRTYLLYPKSIKWLNALGAYPNRDQFLSQQTNLPCKLHRPYLSSAFNLTQCRDALIYHYDTLSQTALPLIRAFYGDEPFMLAALTGKHAQQYRITITSSDKYSREGELTLSCYDENNHALCHLTFSIITYQEKPSLFIAGLQGENNEKLRERIQSATKLCYGLFPKRTLFLAAQVIAEFFNLTQIIAVSNDSHVYTHWRYKHKRFKDIYANYNIFWESLGGHQNQQLLYDLPLTQQQKSLENVPSKKRAQYQHRYQLQDTLQRDIKIKLNQLNRQKKTA